MEPLIQDVLTAAGVDTASKETTLEAWNEWLDVDSVCSMEQCAPLDTAVYTALSKLFEHAWTTVISLEDSTETLATQVSAVQATIWLRNMMDLHVHDQSSFSTLLLNDALVTALFTHISQLPFLQQQIHYLTQSLRQRTTQTSTEILSRLQHYQQTQLLSERLLRELDMHESRLEYILGEWYSVGNTEIRSHVRRHFGRLWHDFVKSASMGSKFKENTSATGIGMTLRVLLRILQGCTQITAVHDHLLKHTLLPLHTPSSMVLWRDQTALLDLYHEPLVQCMAFLLKQRPDWIPGVVEGLLQPDIFTAGNTPKIVLLLHEIDTYLSLLPDNVTSENDYHALISRLSVCMASDNSRTAERSLQFFRNSKFKQHCVYPFEKNQELILKALVKRELPWNPTVRKMTYTVLQELQQYDQDKFSQVANTVFGGGGTQVASASEETTTTAMQVEPEAAQAPLPADRFSLKAGMGDWRPPPSSSRHHAMLPPKSRPPKTGGAPPLTVTGVAPWATSPPLTVTGVAPWASTTTTTTPHKRSVDEARLSETIAEEEEEEEETSSGLQVVLNYMNQLKPADTTDDDGTSSWAKAQMAESPTLLPTLKFHDLVFGHDLGEGAFGVVKYARHIDKTTTRSHWAEYAVKIISTKRIEEMGYETSVKREISILRIMAHPCIARLVSSFRFGDGAYLVLEYASGGDLHSLLKQKGSLDQDSTRFVIAEVASALNSIHELGFVFGDLKPENVLITETGHVKLTDFGACRPVTPAARDLIRPTGQHLLKELRDGDYKEKPVKDDDDAEEEMSTDTDGEEMDHRIEGTTAYLPPEVVLGSIPTPAADAWALGCVLYQCLTGRPPLLDQDDHTTKHKIVTFEGASASGGGTDALFADAHAADITPEARQLICKLLSSRDVRPSMSQIATDPFFGGMNIFELHRKPAIPINVGAVAPVEDAQWARRQYSSIWAPQPKAYDISLPEDPQTESSLLTATQKVPIPEGDEASVFYSWSRVGVPTESTLLPPKKG